MDKRWHVLLEQELSEYRKREVSEIVTADSAEKAVDSTLTKAYKNDSFTPKLDHKVLHVIEW